MSSSPLPAPPLAPAPCPKCGTRPPCYDPAGSRYFGCRQCRTYFRADPLAPTQAGQRVAGFTQALEPGPRLPLGATATLGGYACRVTGYQVRTEKNDPRAHWREYQLRPAVPLASEPADFPLQLAEYHGHWLLIRRAPHHPKTAGKKGYHGKTWSDDQTGRSYDLWHRYQPAVVDAEGEFDWNIFEDEKLFISEYISPPYMLVSEHLTSAPPTWYEAEYLEPAVVAAAFGLPVGKLPTRPDIGAAQPNPVAARPLIALTLLLLLALLGLRALLGQVRPASLSTQEFVVPGTGPEPGALAGPTPMIAVPNDALPPIVPFDSLPPTSPPVDTLTKTPAAPPPPAAPASTMLVTSSFTLTGPAAVNIELTAPGLTNHWAEVTVSLVNEESGRGYEFTRSLEYYEGVESGERWAEGSHSANGLFSSVPAGRYHLNLYPSLEPNTPGLTLQVTTEQNPELATNTWLAALWLLAVPLLQWWRHSAFEKNRWENSNFSDKS